MMAVVDGLLTGGVYALMAAGLTLIFGVLDIINIAQGMFVVLGAYLSYSLESYLKIDLFVGLLITVPAMFLLGLLVEWAFIRRLRPHNRVTMSILVTYAVAIVIEGVLLLHFGSNYLSLNAPYVLQSFVFLGQHIPKMYVFGFGLAAVGVGFLYFLLYRTRLGTSVRAAMDNQVAAALVGVEVQRVATITFGIGVAMTAVGGMVFGAIQPFTPNSSYDLISRLLSIVVLGGLGSVGGALAGALVMLVVEDVVSVVWAPTWGPLVYFAVLVLVLLFRPRGLFGQKEVRAQ